MENENRYYTVSEYAKEFNIAESFVRQMIRINNLPNGHQALKLSEEKSAQVRIWVNNNNFFKVEALEKENQELKNKITEIGNILWKLKIS